MNADGSGQTRLTDDPARDSHPSWSPDGSRIIYHTGPYRDRKIYMMNPDGTGINDVTSGYDTYSPAWSPDGNLIAFVGMSFYFQYIYVMPSEGTERTWVTFVRALNSHQTWDRDGNLTWSPDGSRIAFDSDLAEYDTSLANDRGGKPEIYTVLANGTDRTRLTFNDYLDARPAWSPDGHRIAFVSDRDGNFEIYTMNVDGSNQTRLTNNPSNDSEPAWSPDGSRIVFLSGRDRSSDLYAMNADGSGVVRLTNSTGRNCCPAWGP